MTTISFEFFPPKDNLAQANLLESFSKLSACNPEFFSVTHGAGGARKQGTLETVQLLQQNNSVPAFPHLSCIDAKKNEIEILLNEYLNMGVTRIVALRGDKSPNRDCLGDFNFAADLVKFIRNHFSTELHISVAAYPEAHPETKHSRQDLVYFKEKIDAGADSAITQYFFNADAYFHFIDQCSSQNITVPIIPGIMPIYNVEKLLKFSDYCGAEIPRWILKQLAAYADCEESQKQFGIEVVYSLCEKLLQNGVPGLHFYTLNQASTCIHLCDLLGL